MKKVELNLKAQEKYEVIKRLVEKDGNKERAAVKIGCSIRTINRLIVTYKKEGKSGFLHGNTGRKPSHSLSNDQKAELITLYNNKYWDANFTHACELLKLNDRITVSPTTLSNV
ncbi:MAG: transposase, partial [Lachnospiraceae bacterium]